jgi:ribosomal protein L11
MKKVNIDLMLGRRTECLIVKMVPKDTVIHSTLPAREASKGSPLGPILTRYALDTESVYSQFNSQTFNWLTGTNIPICILTSTPKNFTLETKSPGIYTIINLIWPFDVKTTRVIQIQKKVLLASLFKAAIVKVSDAMDEKLKVRKTFFSRKLKKSFSQAVGTFRSFRVFSFFRRKTKRIYKKKS